MSKRASTDTFLPRGPWSCWLLSAVSALMAWCCAQQVVLFHAVAIVRLHACAGGAEPGPADRRNGDGGQTGADCGCSCRAHHDAGVHSVCNGRRCCACWASCDAYAECAWLKQFNTSGFPGALLIAPDRYAGRVIVHILGIGGARCST